MSDEISSPIAPEEPDMNGQTLNLAASPIRASNDGGARDVSADHQALLARIEATTRWLKRVLDHHGSKDTEDFRAMACEKLLRSEKYGPVLREDPRQLMGMVPRMMRRILIDDARRAGAARRPHRRRAVDIDDYPVAVAAEAELKVDVSRRMARLEEELDRFASGESSARVRAANRAPMAKAVRYKRLGMTDAQIARELGVSKPTVNAWLQVMTAHLAVRLAEGEAP